MNPKTVRKVKAWANGQRSLYDYMRSIKFRALDASGLWHYSNRDTIDFWNGIGNGHLRAETIGQFTGLEDKERKKIWEGDIFKDDAGRGWKYVVEYGPCKFYGKSIETGGNLRPDYHLAIPDKFIVEVIGNIYENPELLSGEGKAS